MDHRKPLDAQAMGLMVSFGVWLLDESLEPGFLTGALMVMAGIVLVSGYGWLKPMPGRQRRR